MWGFLSSGGRERRKETGHQVLTPKSFVPFPFGINLKQKSSVCCFAMSSFLYKAAHMAVKWDGKPRGWPLCLTLWSILAGACQPKSSGRRFWHFQLWWAAIWPHHQSCPSSPSTIPGCLLKLVGETVQPLQFPVEQLSLRFSALSPWYAQDQFP